MTVIKNVTAYTGDALWVGDVAIESGVVSAMSAQIDALPESDVIDGSGLVLGPGLVDIHVHFREPGQTWKEDIASGTAAAAAGGFSAVVMMPNTDPPIASAKTLQQVRDVIKEDAIVEVAVAGCLTEGRSGRTMAAFDDLHEAGVRIFSDDGDSVGDAGLLSRIMTYLSDFPGAVVAQHGEDASITSGGHMNEGAVSHLLGIKGLPASAEEIVIARDIILSARDGCHYHAQHISTAGSVELISRAKEEGLNVTAEVTPHHLTLTDDECADLDPATKMYPPLRLARDVDALIEGLRSGIIDAVATDHAPHTAVEKDVPFEEAPRGVIGLETALPLTLAALNGDLPLLFERMSVAPSRIAGLTNHGHPVGVGVPANLVLIDPKERWTPWSFASKSSNSPFMGKDLTGRVQVTFVDGRVVYGGRR